jgi:Flp pilus assembly CpaE family ATPase
LQIALLTEDETLTRLVAAKIDRPDVRLHPFRSPEALKEALSAISFDHIVLSDRLFELPAFCEFADVVRDRCGRARMTVMLTDRHDAEANDRWIKCALSFGMAYTPAHRTREAIADLLGERFFGKSDALPDAKKVVLFVGSTPNIGTTFVSFGTAVGLARQTTNTVGYLCLNLKSSKLHRYVGIERLAASLDHLRAELRSKSLRPERLKQYCETMRRLPNLHVLFGSTLREQAEYFTPEDVEHLLQTARSAFDVCVIEVNAYWDNAATVCGVLAADVKIMVTTGELTHFQEDIERWLRGLGPLFGLDPSSFDLVLTRLNKNEAAGGIRPKDIRKETGMNVIGKVYDYPGLTDSVNQGKVFDLFLGSHPINRDLQGVVDLLTTVCVLKRKAAAGVRKPRIREWANRIGIWSSKAGDTVWGP